MADLSDIAQVTEIDIDAAVDAIKVLRALQAERDALRDYIEDRLIWCQVEEIDDHEAERDEAHDLLRDVLDWFDVRLRGAPLSDPRPLVRRIEDELQRLRTVPKPRKGKEE